MLGEPFTLRLVIASAVIFGGHRPDFRAQAKRCLKSFATDHI